MPIYTYKCKVCNKPTENYSRDFNTSKEDDFVGTNCNEQHCDGSFERHDSTSLPANCLNLNLCG